MTDRLTVGQFMVTDIVTFTPETEIGKAARVLLEKRIAGAPVVDSSDALVGILTKKDCFKVALSAAYYAQWGGLVLDSMTRKLHTLDASLDIVAAAEQFIATPYRMFPVTSDGKMVGVLSRTDLLSAFVMPRR